MTATTYIALLRGINVSGRNKIPMAELRSLAEGLGWMDIASYIQSGNLIFRANGAPESLEAELERAIERKFDLSIPVIVRSAAEWAEYVKSNPLPGPSGSEPNRVMLALSKAAPKADTVDGLRARAGSGEDVVRVGDALWIHFPAGSGTSKLSPALLDRMAGSSVTMRNWRTVLKLNDLARQHET